MSKKPHPGAVPVLVKGFGQLGQRMLLQKQLLKVLQGRLHEINNGLAEMLRRHDLEISVRAAAARKRHLRLNQQCMRLATKVQVLRNRGYAMDTAEEELKTKLLALEKKVMDPALNGRGEEIWARMVSVRERGRQLQREYEKAGRVVPREQEQGIDEVVMKKATKVCYRAHYFRENIMLIRCNRFWKIIVRSLRICRKSWSSCTRISRSGTMDDRI